MDNHEEFKARLDAYLAENCIEEEVFAEELVAEKISEKKFLAPIKLIAEIYYSRSAPDLRRAKVKLEKIFEEEKESETFSEMMTRLVEESGEKNSAIYNRARISHQFFYRIKRDREYQPSKDTAVVLALALKLDFDKAKDFLAAAGYTLSKSKRDLIIRFFIENKIFDVDELNDYLHEYNQTLLHGR